MRTHLHPLITLAIEWQTIQWYSSVFIFWQRNFVKWIEIACALCVCVPVCTSLVLLFWLNMLNESVENLNVTTLPIDNLTNAKVGKFENGVHEKTEEKKTKSTRTKKSYWQHASISSSGRCLPPNSDRWRHTKIENMWQPVQLCHLIKQDTCTNGRKRLKWTRSMHLSRRKSLFIIKRRTIPLAN